MKNIEFDYITKEQAIELAKLGFPQEYDTLNLEHYYTNLDGGKYRKEPPELVHRWLRDEKHIFIYVEPRYPDMDGANICFAIKHYKFYSTTTYLYEHKTFEDALKSSIDIAIKILKDKIK